MANKETVMCGPIEIPMTTYRILDLYGMYPMDYNSIHEINEAINYEIDRRRDKLISQ